MIALTGATGFLGRAIRAELDRRALPCRRLVRGPGAKPEGVVRGDLADSAALDRLVEGADAVIHAAALMGSSDEAALEETNVAGTRRLVEAARAAEVRRFVLVSSVAAGRPEHGPYSASKRRAEEVAWSSGLDVVVVRPPVLVGPGSQVEAAVARLARLRLVPAISGGRPLRPLGVDDAARACVDAATTREAGATWTLAGPREVSFPALVGQILRRRRAHAAVLPLPGPLALLVAGVAERSTPRPPLTVEAVRAVLAGSPAASVR